MSDRVVVPITGDLASEVSFDSDVRQPRLKTQEAALKLRTLGVEYDVHNHGNHIKAGHVNYYPSTGSVMLDGQRKFKRKGLDFFIEVLRSAGLCR